MFIFEGFLDFLVFFFGFADDSYDGVWGEPDQSRS